MQQNNSSSKDPLTLLLLAYLHAVPLAVETNFVDLSSAHFRSFGIGPIEAVWKELCDQATYRYDCLGMDMSMVLSLMKFPMDTVSNFRSRVGYSQNLETSDTLLNTKFLISSTEFDKISIAETP
jgi:hypothetical protein